MSVIYNNSQSEFYKTYVMYREYLGYSEPYSYRSWMRLSDKMKAAALYVQFYDQITLAWYKVNTVWSIEAEGVECINQYLIKNVQKIDDDPKRFSPRYIYKVAYNCLYCVCIDPTKQKQRYQNEVSDRFDCGGDELSWFDKLYGDEDVDVNTDAYVLAKFFDSLEQDVQIYIGYVLGELTANQACTKLKRGGYINGNLRNKEYVQSVVASMLEFFPEKLKYIMQHSEVWQCDTVRSYF